MGDPKISSSGSWNKRFADYKEKLLAAALLGVPTALVAKLTDSLSARLFSQPWQAIWFLLPIGIGIWVLRRRLGGGGCFPLERRLLAFLGAYLLLFSVAAQASFLDWSREVTAFGAPASRRWLAPVSWGDWRYRLVPKKADPSDELFVVLLEPAAGRSLRDSRKELVDVIAMAVRGGARGVALDVYFEGPSAIDPLLCHTIATAPIPVLVGYGFERTRGHIAELPPPDTLRPCLTPDRQAHLAGFLDVDLVTRVTPMFFRNDRNRPALGLAVARALSPDAPIDVPADGLLRFIPPAAEPPTARFEELRTDASSRNLLRNRFVMAGEESERDSFNTAFGRKPGIAIHSYVVHSLRQAHYIRQHSWGLGLAITLVFCLWMTAWCGGGAPVRRLVALGAGATVAIVAVATASILWGPYWFDVVYPAVAVWLLLPLLVGLRRGIPARASSAVVTRSSSAEAL